MRFKSGGLMPWVGEPGGEVWQRRRETRSSCTRADSRGGRPHIGSCGNPTTVGCEGLSEGDVIAIIKCVPQVF